MKKYAGRRAPDGPDKKTKKPEQPGERQPARGLTTEQFSTLFGEHEAFVPDDDPIEPFSDSEYNGL